MSADLLIDTKTWESLIMDLKKHEESIKKSLFRSDGHIVEIYDAAYQAEKKVREKAIKRIKELEEERNNLQEQRNNLQEQINNLRNSMRAVEFSISEFHKKEEERKRKIEWEKEKKKLESQCGDRNGGEHQYSWNCERKKGHDGECSPFPDKD